MDNVPLFLYLWFVHVAVTLPIVVAVVWFTRRRVRWQLWESAVFFVPFGVWLALMFAGLRPKTLANLGECFMISAAIVVASVLRPLVGSAPEARLAPVLLLVAVIATGIAAYFLMPMEPEV